MKTFLLSSALLLASIVSSAQSGQTMPSVSLKDIEGKTINTADYSKNGKITIVTFWATWCTPCKKELMNINDNMLDDWKSKYGVELVAVSTDNAKNVMKVKPYVDGMGWDFDCLLDVNEDLRRAVNAPSVPFTILLDRAGKIVYSHFGYIEGDEYMLEEKIKSVATAASK
jgi:peroxiredoxin